MNEIETSDLDLRLERKELEYILQKYRGKKYARGSIAIQRGAISRDSLSQRKKDEEFEKKAVEVLNCLLP